MCLRISTLLILALCSPALLLSQRTVASISGTVTDSSGAVVSGADVQVTDTNTGSVVGAKTNESGFYLLPSLPPHTYLLRIEKTGFNSYQQTGISLVVDQQATIDVKLSVGQQTDTVSVSAQANEVDIRSPTLSTVITPEMAVALPLNGRNVLQLMALSPDVSPSGGTYAQYATRPESTTTLISASGGRGNSTAFYLDGGLNEDPYTQVANIFPNPDAIQEFNFQTNTYSAKFGGRGGGVVNAVTRGGSNMFHGTAYEYYRNSNLNAENFFATAGDGLKRNQFGFSFGGPVKRDRTFFFAAYQGTRVSQAPTQNFFHSYTPAELAGDFSSTPVQLSDPDTGLPFANNQIPTSLFDPVALNFAKLTPVGDATDGLASYVAPSVQNDDQWIGRVDHTFNSKFQVFGRYLYDRLNEPGEATKYLISATAGAYWLSQNVTASATYTPRADLTGNLNLTYNRAAISYLGPNQPGITGLGANVPIVSPAKTQSIDTYVNGYFSAFWDGEYRVPRNEYDISSNWSYERGAHTLEFGGEIAQQVSLLFADYDSGGNIAFSNQLSGNNLSDFFLGKPSEFSLLTPTYENLVRNVPGLFVTDTWKVSRRLTLSLGVRWSAWIPWHETLGNQISLFSFDAYNDGVHSARYPNLPPGLLTAGDKGVPRTAISTNYAIFDPRIGFAYDLNGDGKTSIRGGYGIYHDEPGALVNNRNLSSPPWNQRVDYTTPYSLSDPFEGRVNPFHGLVPTPLPSNSTYGTPFLEVAYGTRFPYPTIQQFNLTVEREMPASILFRLSYVGSESYHLFGGVENNAGVYIPGGSTFSNTNARRPIPYFTELTIAEASGTNSYNALVVDAEKRAAHGLTFITGFRWAKQLDETSSSQFESDSYASSNIAADRGLGDSNVGKQFVFSGVWQLPAPDFGNRLVKGVLGGWNTSGLLTLRTGNPFTIASGLDYSYSGIGLDRGDLVPGQTAKITNGRSTIAKANGWFNTDAFTYNAPGTIGDTGRNSQIGPSYRDVDVAFYKSISLGKGLISESNHVDLRAEFFNALNHPNLGNPDSTVNDGPGFFGHIFSANPPRIVQLAVRYVF